MIHNFINNKCLYLDIKVTQETLISTYSDGVVHVLFICHQGLPLSTHSIHLLLQRPLYVRVTGQYRYQTIEGSVCSGSTYAKECQITI